MTVIIKKDNYSSLEYLNLFKIIAAIVIAVLLHYWDHFAQPVFFQDNLFLNVIITYGATLTEVFFLISGMLFYLSYNNRLLSKELSYRKFILNRFIRIWPLMFITTLYVYFMNMGLYNTTGTLFNTGTLDPWQLILSLFIGGSIIFNNVPTNNGPVWYLSVLLLCYLVACLLILLHRKLKKPYLFVVPIVMGVPMIVLNRPYPFFNLSVGRGFVFFFVGIYLIMFLQWLKKCNKATTYFTKGISAALSLSFFIILFMTNIRSSVIVNPILILGFCFHMPLIILAYDANWINRFSKFKVFKKLGEMSFDIYVWNFPIYITFALIIRNGTNIGQNEPWFLLIILIVHLVIGFLSNYFVQNKLIGLIKKKIKL